MARHELTDRHVVITGASSGIGAALAVELARRGAKLGLIARRGELLESVQRDVEAVGGRAAFAAADVTDINQLTRAVTLLEKHLGPTYGMVANAGLGRPTGKGLVKVPRDTQTLEVNVMGVVNAVAAVQPGMMERGEGFLSVVSSVAGTRGLPGSAAYCASKAAVSTFFESLRVDLRGTGVSVIAIHPGFIRTPMTDTNKFPMPFLMDVEPAARIIARSLVRGQARLTFPWQMAIVARLMRWVPNFLWDRIGGARK
ncbi:MAG: SDR family NAD(P)-dependent oxidoreductase [Myxococcota bacterium]|nr:SDR family NAD(P)-dependent oxidoreductase [Myxococcota bacterium]